MLARNQANDLIVSKTMPRGTPKNLLWHGDTEKLLDCLPDEPIFDLVVSSPPYNIGKVYERQTELQEYEQWQSRVLSKIVSRLKPSGSLCWQVGNYIVENEILPLDILFHPIMKRLDLKLRNRIVWTFGHGLHTRRRFSGRHEVVMWYTKGDKYTFNLDAVRVRSKYPGKRSFRGPNQGMPSGNPMGKNPEDVWEFLYEEIDDVWQNIPNVKSNHIEKTEHPCQYPVGLIERLVLGFTNPGDLVFDPFAGVGSAGVAALLHKRRFWGSELNKTYVSIAQERLIKTLSGEIQYRAHTTPLYDHTKSRLSLLPTEWTTEG
jgi:adenine-specific DNA-methyltransferase